MDWIKANYDRVLLAALGLAALGCGVFMIMSALAFPELFLTRNSSKPADNTIPTPPVALVEVELVSLEKPSQWSPRDSSLFVSKPYVLKDDELINPLEGGTALHPPVPNEWLVRFGLDWAAGDVLDSDPDDDGFSNIEEFQGDTDPTAAESHPPYYTKLRLREFVQIPFRLKFSGSPDDGTTFSINTLDLRQPTQFLKLGESVDNTPYRLVSYEPKEEDRNGLKVDVSELTIENVETGEKIALVYDQVVNSPTAFADLVNLWDGVQFRVKKTDDFSFQPEENVKYKLIDITETEAVIQRADTGKEFRVPKEG